MMHLIRSQLIGIATVVLLILVIVIFHIIYDYLRRRS